jgi:outer membrane lipoprotein-sorting protein
MARMNIPEMMEKYKLKEVDLNCLLIYLSCENKTYAWSQTIGIESESKNKNIIANQWFKNPNIIKFIYDYEKKREDKVIDKIDKSSDVDRESKSKSFEQIKNEVIQTFGFIEDITSDNIKELIINEINCSKDPEKRATLLMKVSDLLSLYNVEDEDFQTPVIYLPARCKDCTYKR